MGEVEVEAEREGQKIEDRHRGSGQGANSAASTDSCRGRPPRGHPGEPSPACLTKLTMRRLRRVLPGPCTRGIRSWWSVESKKRRWGETRGRVEVAPAVSSPYISVLCCEAAGALPLTSPRHAPDAASRGARAPESCRLGLAVFNPGCFMGPLAVYWGTKTTGPKCRRQQTGLP